MSWAGGGLQLPLESSVPSEITKKNLRRVKYSPTPNICRQNLETEIESALDKKVNSIDDCAIPLRIYIGIFRTNDGLYNLLKGKKFDDDSYRKLSVMFDGHREGKRYFRSCLKFH